MKTIRIITQLAILASMGLTSCQEYEAGFTADDIFRGTYSRKFVEKHGAIDSEETWDLSTAGGRRSGECATRAAGTYTSVASADGYYYLPEWPELKISVSLGATYYDGRTDSCFEQLYREADKRLYLSKQIKGCQLTV